jgi:site-specific DNA-methyltransferase (adenine-specific)
MIQEVWLGDCLELMKNIPDKSVDMILCDLPYGTTACGWDVVIPFAPLWEQYKRVVKDKAAIVLFGSEPFSSHLRLSNLKMYKYDWYWRKERLTNVMQIKRRPGKIIENISVFYEKQCNYFPQKTLYLGPERKNVVGAATFGNLVDGGKLKPRNYKDDGTRYPLQLLDFKRNLRKLSHPTEKPVPLLEYLIKTYTNEGDLVLDNCAGSGSTLVAAKNLGRQFIGIERDDIYFEIAKRRVSVTEIQTRRNS